MTTERAGTARVGDKILIARPGLILGPGDLSDRFGYWPARLRHGGRVLAPTTADRFEQVIDVGDLATWIFAAGISGVTGIVNAVGESHAFDNFLSEVSDVAGFAGELVAVDNAWLLGHDVHYWAGPGHSRCGFPSPTPHLRSVATPLTSRTVASSARPGTRFHRCVNMKWLATQRTHGFWDSARRKKPTFSTGRAKDWHPWK